MGLPRVACMDDDEIEAWRTAAMQVRMRGAAAQTLDPCIDCLASFAEQMRSEGRCNGIPGMARRLNRADPPSRDVVQMRRAYLRRVCHRLGIDVAHADLVS